MRHMAAHRKAAPKGLDNDTRANALFAHIACNIASFDLISLVSAAPTMSQGPMQLDALDRRRPCYFL